MGLKLLILGWWTPKYLIRRELTNINDRTITALKTLIPETARQEATADPPQQSSRGIEQQRAAMAQTHAQLVEKLASVVGRDQAVVLGRNALFLIGEDSANRPALNLASATTQKTWLQQPKSSTAYLE